jgi:hypothetical protein
MKQSSLLFTQDTHNFVYITRGLLGLIVDN